MSRFKSGMVTEITPLKTKVIIIIIVHKFFVKTNFGRTYLNSNLTLRLSQPKNGTA